jgi:hypothetical protein
MIELALTSDNPQLSEPSKTEFGVSYFRASGVNLSVPEVVEGYIRDSMAEATRRAYSLLLWRRPRDEEVVQRPSP